MSKTTIYKSETAFAYIPIPAISASTSQGKYIILDPSTSATKPNFATTYDLEELEWNQLINKPRVRRKLNELALEALRQFELGETEEGGFAVE